MLTLAAIPLAQSWFPSTGNRLVDVMPLIGLALILLALLSFRIKRHRGGPNLTARERLEQLRQRDGMRNDLEGLMVEIEQLAKRFGAQLDAKALRLEALLRDADAKIAELRRLSETGRADWPPPNPREQSGDPLAQKVCDLADQGLSPVDIARRLDEHVGKVELILALRQR